MTNIYQSVTELIGHTPLLAAKRFAEAHDLPANIVVKLEYFNPAGSVKDRIAIAMIEQAEKDGKIAPGATLIEPTSGNTGIGIAAVAAARGYHAILTMPETMSVERRNLLKAYGAEIVLTEGAQGMKGAIARAEQLQKEIPNSFIPSQFENPANPAVHERTTGPEIWTDTDGNVAAFVSGVGTGRPLSKEQKSIHSRRCRRAGRFASALGRQAGTAQDSRHRCRLYSHDSRYESIRRGHSGEERGCLCLRQGVRTPRGCTDRNLLRGCACGCGAAGTPP